MPSLPIRRDQFKTGAFAAWLAKEGAEIGKPTNPYEVIRYRAFWRGTKKAAVHIVYAKENGLLTFTGDSAGHYRAFLAGSPIDELPGPTPAQDARRRELSPKKKPKSKAPTRANLLKRDGNECWFCGKEMAADDMTIEHLVPKAKGGRNFLANYALAHADCNRRAGDMPLVEKIELRTKLREKSDA